MARPRELTMQALPRPAPFCCPGARRFASFVTKLLADVRQDPDDPVVINRGKLLLLDRFMAERAGASAGHRDRVADEEGKICLYGVFLGGYEELRERELRVDPPPIVPPSLPPPTFEEVRAQFKAAKRERKRSEAPPVHWQPMGLTDDEA